MPPSRSFEVSNFRHRRAPNWRSRSVSDRTAIPRGRDRELRSYFGAKKCVVTDFSPATWHHLDDDPQNHVLGNLVPLEGCLNDSLGKAALESRKGGRPLLDARLTPEALATRAMSHYLEWRIAPAYGCARLAVFVAREYCRRTASEVLEFASNAFWYARHRLNYDLLEDIVTRDILPVVSARSVLRPSAITAALHELCTLLHECGDHNYAHEAYETLDVLATSLRRSTEDPFRYAGIVRRQATMLLADSGLTSEVLTLIEESQSAAASNEAVQLGGQLAKAWGHLHATTPNKAAEFVEHSYRKYIPVILPGGEVVPKGVTLGMVAELSFHYCINVITTRPHGWKRKLEHGIGSARALYSLGGHRVPEILPGFWSLDEARTIESRIGLRIRRSQLPDSLKRKVASAIRSLASLTRGKPGTVTSGINLGHK